MLRIWRDGGLAVRAEVFGQVFVLAQHLTRRTNAELEPLGLTTSQWLLLAVDLQAPRRRADAQRGRRDLRHVAAERQTGRPSTRRSRLPRAQDRPGRRQGDPVARDREGRRIVRQPRRAPARAATVRHHLRGTRRLRRHGPRAICWAAGSATSSRPGAHHDPQLDSNSAPHRAEPHPVRTAIRTATAALFVVHGLILFIGFAKAFGLVEFSALTQPISHPTGLLWLAAAVLCWVTAGALFLAPRWWWAVGAFAVVLSQIVIVTSWTDASSAPS